MNYKLKSIFTFIYLTFVFLLQEKLNFADFTSICIVISYDGKYVYC